MSTMTKKMNDTLGERIYSLLGEIRSGLDKLYACLRTQQKALAGWRMDEFIGTVQLQQQLVEANIKLEKQRRELVAELLGEAAADTANLRTVAEHLGGLWPEKFREAASRIKISGDLVAAVKSQNEQLIARNREMIEGQLRLIFELASLNRNTYGKSGNKAGRTDMHKVWDQRA